MLRQKHTLVLVLMTSFVWNGVPAAAQAPDGQPDRRAEITRSSDAAEVFASLQRSGRDEAFAQAVQRIAGDQGDTSDALEAQTAYFYEQFRGGRRHDGRSHAKGHRDQ